MLISFSVQNFRSIRKKISLDFRASSDKHLEDYFVVEIPSPKLRLLKIAMIYGANASGKTSILMAMDFLRHTVLNPPQDKNIPIKLPAFALAKSEPSSFEIEFYYQDVCFEYDLELNQHRVLHEVLYHYPKGRKAKVFERVYLSDKEGYNYIWTDKSYGKTKQARLELTIPNQTLLSAIASIDDQGPMQVAHDWFRFELRQLIFPNMSLEHYTINRLMNRSDEMDFILSQMRKADLWIDDIRIEEDYISLDKVPPEVQNVIKHHATKEGMLKTINYGFVHRLEEGEFYIDYHDESFGTQRYFGFCVLLHDLIFKNACIPIDEIESSLHLDLIIHFLISFLKNSERGQVLFTSQSTALLSDKILARRDCIWITDRKPDGSTVLTSLWDYPVRKEHAIDKLFRKGLIGGKPILGSTDIEIEHEKA